MLKVFMFNREKDFESKTVAVLANNEGEAIRMVCDATQTNSNTWVWVADQQADKPGIVGTVLDYLGV